MRMTLHQPLFTIGIVARLLKLHEQTIRQYERLGLIAPSRTAKHTRMYSQADVERLECIMFLVKQCGVNLAGVKLMVQFGLTRPEIENFLKAQVRLKDLQAMSSHLLPPSQEECHATDPKERPAAAPRPRRRK